MLVEAQVKSLHLVTTNARRGAETFAVNLADGLTASGHPARTVALTASGSHEAHSIPTLGASRRAPSTLSALRSTARRAEVVAAHGSATLEACAIGLAGTGRPFVYRTIGDPSYWVTTSLRRRWVGGMLRTASRHVVLWSGAAEQLAERYDIPRHKIDVIPNAVPAATFPLATTEMRIRARRRLRIGDDQPCLAFVGALSPEKDVGVAIRAAAEIQHVVLLIAGDGPELARLQEQAAQQASGRVRFLGSMWNPSEVYAAADLLLLPSRSEGMPGVLIEAALTGTPTVATAVGAVPEMLSGTDAGHLVPAGDPSAFVLRVGEALEERERLTEASVAVFRRRYAIENVVPSWRETLLSALPV